MIPASRSMSKSAATASAESSEGGRVFPLVKAWAAGAAVPPLSSFRASEIRACDRIGRRHGVGSERSCP